MGEGLGSNSFAIRVTLIPACSSDVGPPQGLNLIPLYGMLQSHMISDTVGMGEGLGARNDGTGGRVSGIMMIQVRPHGADVLQRPAAERALVTVLAMMLPQQPLLPVVRLSALILASGRDRRGGRDGRLINWRVVFQ